MDKIYIILINIHVNRIFPYEYVDILFTYPTSTLPYPTSTLPNNIINLNLIILFPLPCDMLLCRFY